MTRNWIWSAYLLALVLSVAMISCDRQQASPKMWAASTLPAGHRLSTGDAVLDGDPYYVRKEIKKGAQIAPDNLASLPLADVPAGMLPLVLKVQSSADGTAPNAGNKLWICPATGKAEEAVSVISTLCDHGGSSCLAIVALPADRAATLGTSKSPQLSKKRCQEASNG